MANPANQSGRRKTLRRVFIWIGSAVFVLVLCAFTAGEIVLHRTEPLLKAKVIDALSSQFDSRVELDRFHVSLVEGLKVSGGGLSLYPRSFEATTPLFAVKDFSFSTTWRELFQTPMYIAKVHVTGLAIHLPPKGQRPQIPHPSSSTGGGGGIKISIGEILCENATLVMGTNKPGRIPLEFDIGSLQLTSIGPGQPMKFHAILVNPKPVGNIDSTGYFGPFNQESPGDSPVSGDYEFRNADLATLKGIGGILSSQGKYEGTLNNITVDGETTTPDFRLNFASHPVPLNTKFHAIVDGTNGDTHLEPVDAWLLHSHIIAKGDVVRAANHPGHDIRLDVTLNPAQIQDVLELGATSDTPILTGDLEMHTSLHLPPGDESVIDRLQLAGSFVMLNAHFISDKFQSKVDQLSLRGQGKAREAQQEGKANKQNGADGSQPANIASTIRGDFVFSNARIILHKMEYLVPGATIGMDGVYALKGQLLDFRGTARLDAKVSQMVTGWKSLLLMPVDPYFSKHGSGVEVPITVTGSRSDPIIGIEFGGKEHEMPQSHPSAKPSPQSN
jgi:hypothetical protein